LTRINSKYLSVVGIRLIVGTLGFYGEGPAHRLLKWFAGDTSGVEAERAKAQAAQPMPKPRDLCISRTDAAATGVG
jgi:hypothetical protein